jgi:hypothetical protein
VLRAGRQDGAASDQRGGEQDMTAAITLPLALSAGPITGFAVLYVLLLLFLGIRSLKHGHWIMFLIGIPLPIFWVIGGLIPPVED